MNNDQPSLKQKLWYINYQNSRPDRKKCPDCGAFAETKLDVNGDVYVSITCKENCKLLTEWNEWREKQTETINGNLYLMFRNYLRNKKTYEFKTNNNIDFISWLCYNSYTGVGASSRSSY